MRTTHNCGMEKPCGSWASPITARKLVDGAASPGEIALDGDHIWWAESRPSEGGRIQIVHRTPDGACNGLLSDGWSARTRVHEYGGGAWAVHDSTLVFANWSDQRLYRVADGGKPTPLTPAPSVPNAWRYADIDFLRINDERWLVCVRESHQPEAVETHGEAVNEIVAVPLDGSAADDPQRVRTLVSGPDFVAAPRIGHRPDGSTALAWLQWHHPNMPWDGTELWTAAIQIDGPTGEPTELIDTRQVAGGPGESVVQPQWAPEGALWWSSDRTGWWNLYRDGQPIAPIEAEIGGPMWVLGKRWYAMLSDGRIAASVVDGAFARLGIVDPQRPGEPPALLDTDLTWIDHVAAAPGGAILAIAATPTTDLSPLLITADGTVEPLRPARDLDFGPEWFSSPEPIDFSSASGRTAHALLYRPTNPHVQAPPGERPPLLVVSHGGPTSHTRAMLSLATQFWTSRGFVVVDVNYGGSTGYGRPYRDLLCGQWGVVDVEDCVAAARWLADQGIVDAGRLAIRGGSAGGFTTLAALAFTDTFDAGASHYGVADLAALARDTHKFESRYLDALVGPWPEAAEVYAERSPIQHTDDLSCPLIVLQGLEDEVVPPAQAEMIVEALRRKGLPHAYVTFPGEQHGFRDADNIVRALESELWFYGRVFGFEPADRIEPPPAEGL